MRLSLSRSPAGLPVGTPVVYRDTGGSSLRRRSAAARSLVLSDLTLAEIVYVLQGPYARPREEVAHLVEATLSLVSVAVDNEGLLRRTLEHYGQRHMDWPDAYLVALVEQRHLDGLLSFGGLDARLAGLSVVRREP